MSKEELNDKYFQKILDSVSSYLNGFQTVLQIIEKNLTKDFLSKYKIESSELNMPKVNKLLRDFFQSRNIVTATDIKNGLIAVFKKIKIDIASSKQITYQALHYDLIEDAIKKQFKEYVNQYGFHNQFDYMLIDNYRSLTQVMDEEDDDDEVFEKYLNPESFPELIELIIEKLDHIENIIDSYGLSSIHNIDYEEEEFSSLSECISKKQYKKQTSTDIAKVCETLKLNDTRDYFDFTSENYILFIITLFDCMKVALDYYNFSFAQKGEELIVTKDIRPLISLLKKNFNYFLDKELILDTDFINLYMKIHNDLVNYDYFYYYSFIMSVEKDV